MHDPGLINESCDLKQVIQFPGILASCEWLGAGKYGGTIESYKESFFVLFYF